MSLVLLFIWPIEVEGWIATESAVLTALGVKTQFSSWEVPSVKINWK